MESICSVWNFLVTANPKIEEIDQRIRSKLLAIILIFMNFVGIAGLLAEVLLVTGIDRAFYTVLVGHIALVAAFFINRAGHLLLATLITIAMPLLTTIAVVHFKPEENFTFAFVPISVFMAFIFLPTYRGMLTVLAIILVEAVYLFHWPEVAPKNDFVLPVVNILLMATMTLIFIWHQRRQEQIRNIELIQKEKNLERAQQIANLGSWVWDIKANKAAWSDQLYNIYGIDPQQFDGDVWNIVDRYTHPEDLSLLKERVEHAIKNREPVETEYRIRDVQGNEKVLWAEIGVKLNSHGEVSELYGIAQDITERNAVENAIRQSERELSHILNSIQDTYYRTNMEGKLLRISPSVEQLLGYTVDELLCSKLSDLYVDEDGRDKFLMLLKENNGSVLGYEARLRHKNGSYVWVSTNSQYYYDEAGNVVGVEGLSRDVTGKKQAELEMQKLSSALQQTADSVLIMDKSGDIEFVNAAFESFTGLKKDKIIGKNFSTMKPFIADENTYVRMLEEAKNAEVASDTFVNRNNPNHPVYEQKTITPVRIGSNEITHFIMTGKNITDYMKSQEKLQYLAQHDVLTGLPNRSLFMDRLGHAVSIRRGTDDEIAVLFLDLDRFKGINDSLGHDVGDLLLKEMALRIKNIIRDGDTIGRLGGDEFAIILENVHTNADISHISRKILESVEPPFTVDGRNLHVTASVGISLFPSDTDSPELLLRYADIAMYRAKDMGKNNFQFYSRELSTLAFERLNLENNLRDAVKNREFIVHFQPQFEVETMRIVGLEALLRWKHPQLGMIMPADFIYALEETGMIDEVGEWVLRKSCEQMKLWHDRGHTELTICVNVSGRQCHSIDFVKKIKSLLEEIGLDPRALELEITESILLRNVRSVDDSLKQLSEMGIRLAIDDFGTGYSSLSYLKLFPIDTLKIDRSFVRDVEHDNDDLEIVKTILAMGKTLGMNVIAEGVETEGQKRILMEQGCHVVQGYLLAKPMPIEDLDEVLQQGAVCH